VAVERKIWSGEARMVIARTTEGELGILPNHSPVLSLMVHGFVDIRSSDGETHIAAVDTGFISVAANRVSILASRAMLSSDIELDKARSDLEGQPEPGEDDDDEAGERAWLEAQVRAAEHAS
jgi:F-type H+-transporting ATPase subunit epsilon